MTLAYKEFGEGIPVVILHGLYGSSDNWVTIGRRLAKHYKVYLIDLRNHGDSPHSPDHAYKSLAKDVIEFVNYKKLNRFYLIGHSMGGKTAIAIASQIGDKIIKQIIVDILPVIDSENDATKEIINQHKGIIKALSDLPIQSLTSRGDIDAELSKAVPVKAVRQFLLKNISRNESNDFEWKINLHAIQNHLPEILGNLNLQQNNPKLKNVDTLFIKGEKSPYITESSFNISSELFLNCKLKEIKNSGHWVHAEAPREFLESVLEFFG